MYVKRRLTQQTLKLLICRCFHSIFTSLDYLARNKKYKLVLGKLTKKSYGFNISMLKKCNFRKLHPTNKI